MREDMSFASYRYFLVSNNQISIFDTHKEKRAEVIKRFYENLEKEKKLTFSFDNRKHIIVYNRKINNDILICKFSRENLETRYQEGNIDIENFLETNYPFIYLIIDIKRQIVLMEIKTNVFTSVNAAKKKLEKCLNISFGIYNFEVKLDEITDENDFWNHVASSSGVYSLFLKLNSPNLFGGYVDTNKMLIEINQEYNNTETSICLSNKKAELNSVNKENPKLVNAIKYTSGGGGEWTLTVHTENGKRMFKSKHNIKKVKIKNIEGNSDKDSINKEILDSLATVETILINREDIENENKNK